MKPIRINYQLSYPQTLCYNLFIKVQTRCDYEIFILRRLPQDVA